MENGLRAVPAARFGTDGVRGVAGRDLTAALALEVAAAAVDVLAAGVARPLVLVGRDTRPSGPMLEAATVAGLLSRGAHVVTLGVVPTPAVAHLTDLYGAHLSVMLSASHNPSPDNGIKVFGPGGRKLTDAQEHAIEAALGAPRAEVVGAAVGHLSDGRAAAAAHYLAHLREVAREDLTGLRIVVDCAHGAAAALAPEAYRAAGAEVVVTGADPDGVINDGVGSTPLDHLAALVVAEGADLGIAHDGDADRCLAVDGEGTVVDGDQILALCALAMRERGALVDDTVVATVMSNLGFHHAMRDHGIEVVTTAVGDRYVLEVLAERGLSLGGEQSGHLVFTDAATTGDGLLTALRLMGHVARSGRSLAELARVVTRLPQVLLNVRVGDRDAVSSSPSVGAAVAAAEARLGEDGRVLLRPSGTEPVVRVMVEAPTDAEARHVAESIAEVVGAV